MIKRVSIHQITKFIVVMIVTMYCSMDDIRAQNSTFVSAQKDRSGVTIKFESRLLRLEVCDQRTIHVMNAVGDALPVRKDFAVIKDWTPAPFAWQELNDKLKLSTSKVAIEIDRESGSIAFLDSAGKTLLEEPAQDARSLKAVDTPADQQLYLIEQTFLSPENEHIHGLSQSQDGIRNWRGMPIELRQVNTQAAIPVMVSSQGYGLFWNNSSLTDFNPVDYEIPLTTDRNTENDSGPIATEQLNNQNRDRSQPPARRTGTFTSGETGTYVFFVKGGNRRDELGIKVNDEIIAHIQNLWVPYTITGTIDLPANTECSIKVLGGGNNAKKFARPLGNTTTFRSQLAESIDYYFFYGPEPDEIISAYRNATGTAPLWPKWAYGFWQCRERYSSQKHITDTVNEFRERQIPVDLIVQDWQYWGNHGWGAYQWNSQRYPDPQKMIQDIHDQNVKYMISVWSNPQGTAGNDFKSKNLVVPGTDWVDAFNPEARKRRWEILNEVFFQIGTDAWWQDAVEPGDDGNALVVKKIHLGWGDRYRNAYPIFANQTVYEGQRAANIEKRVCILTRSHFPGQQRYATALWSGDIGGNWEAFAKQIPAGLHVCMTGLPYWTTDCGGFFRPRDQYRSEDFQELLVRWFQYSTFSPVQRMHGYQSQTEFWKFPKAMDTMVEYDKFRYRLLPYIYSIAWQVTNEHYTIMRALPMDFRNDPKVMDISDQYMFGPAFLVTPITKPGTESRDVYLPVSTSWWNFWTGQTSTGGQNLEASAPKEIIPLFIKAGSIIPMGPDLQYTSEKPADPIELRVYAGAAGSFTLYEDEGDSYRYEEGVYATIRFDWDDTAKTLTIGERKGEFPRMLRERTFHIVWVSPKHGVGMNLTGQPDSIVKYDGENVQIKRIENQGN